MVTAAKQLAIGGLDEEREIGAEIEAGYLWREQLWSAMRQFAANYVSASGLKGYDAVAAELDRRWGPKGRPVSASVLRAALMDVERNNFRLEWADWFAARDPEIAALLGRRVKPEKTPEQELADLKAEIAAELPRRADAIIRKARTR